MSARVIAIGLAALVWAVPVVAQERGTMEFGAFGSAASFDHSLSLTNAFGGGGRAAMFLDPRWSLEFEKAEMKASRPSGLSDVNVGVLSSRLMFVPVRAGRLSLLVGAGGGISTETNFMHSYGVDGLVGAKLALTDNAALRVDGVWDWLANQDWKTYRSVRVGISVYRHPSHAMRLVTVVAPPRSTELTVVHEDSVSAMETARLRDRDAALRTLRDSLSGATSTSAATLATMEAQIHFAFDKSELTDSATALLDDKIGVFRANPAMTIVLLGYTDVTGTDRYNMALGERRAQAAKDYIVAHGIAANRVIIESRGERHQIANSAGEAGEAPNRRAIFRLLIAPDVIRQQ
jgi:outer membrane protein OmpA-like peptidoglycan-associated protein